MSATLLVLLSVLATQDPSPRPYSSSQDLTQRPYEPPAIRPFETAPGPEVRDPMAFFDQGVSAAERAADARAGPLDGRWWVVDADGQAVGSLVLNDPGDGLVEGAWRRGHIGQAVPLATASSDGASLALALDGGDSLRLQRAGGGWRGSLVHDGRARPVTLRRP